MNVPTPEQMRDAISLLMDTTRHLMASVEQLQERVNELEALDFERLEENHKGKRMVS